jgi:hypothetical protein
MKILRRLNGAELLNSGDAARSCSGGAAELPCDWPVHGADPATILWSHDR